MDETLNQARNMFANHAMTNLIDATHNLIERYSVAGAKIYLEAQLQILAQLAERRAAVDDDELVF